MYNVFGFMVLILLLALPVALVKPSLFTKMTKGTVTSRKRALGVFGGGLVSSFLLFGVTAPPTIPETNVKEESTKVQPIAQPLEQLIATLEPTIEPSPSPLPIATPTPKPSVKASSRSTTIPTQKPAVTKSNPQTSTSGGDKDCKDFSSQSAAQAYFDARGGSASNNVDRLDGNDKDGKVCESLP